jgi:tRNA U34 2-thiouridine synthase MnmA/TrmU
VYRTNWLVPVQEIQAVSVKIRYAHPGTPATVRLLDVHRARACLQVPQRAVTPGQAAVIYDGDRVLGVDGSPANPLSFRHDPAGFHHVCKR